MLLLLIIIDSISCVNNKLRVKDEEEDMIEIPL
jgi:hypothetical protein